MNKGHRPCHLHAIDLEAKLLNNFILKGSEILQTGNTEHGFKSRKKYLSEALTPTILWNLMKALKSSFFITWEPLVVQKREGRSRHGMPTRTCWPRLG
jgi:hypothetical protein